MKCSIKCSKLPSGKEGIFLLCFPMGAGCPVSCVTVERRVACLGHRGKLHPTAGELISKLVKPLGLKVPSYSLLLNLWVRA